MVHRRAHRPGAGRPGGRARSGSGPRRRRPPPRAPSPGSAVARLHAPSLGWSYVVGEGVGIEDLKDGPGHDPGTALPGQLGNAVISGHRTTYGAPFRRLLDLRDGDPLVVETRTAWVTYRVTERAVVAPSAVEVTWPVPGVAGAVPTQHLLTLTTCHPEYSARSRLVVRAVEESSLPRTAGVRPAALTGRR